MVAFRGSGSRVASRFTIERLRLSSREAAKGATRGLAQPQAKQARRPPIRALSASADDGADIPVQQEGQVSASRGHGTRGSVPGSV
jgi:hypothetical protein